jgi:hypothetical protein
MSKPPRRAKASVLTVAQYRQTGSEHSLQVSVLEYLRLHARVGVYWFAIPNAGKRSYRTAKQMVAEGLTAGVADLCIMLNGGVVVWLELKTKANQLSDAQRAFASVCRELDHPYHIIRDLPEAIDVFRRWNVLREFP